jgi:hypothetical protein
LIDHKEHEGHEVLKKIKWRVLLRAQDGMAERWSQKNNKSRAYFCLYFSDDCLFCNSHGGDFGTGAKKRKTYGRFFGMIFFGGVWAALVLEGQGVAGQKIPKIRKSAKKSVKYFWRERGFSAEEKLMRRMGRKGRERRSP